MTPDTIPAFSSELNVAVIDAVHSSRRAVETELSRRAGVTAWSYEAVPDAVKDVDKRGTLFDWIVIDPANLPSTMADDAAIAEARLIARGITPYTVNPAAFLDTGGVSKISSSTDSLVDLVLELARREIQPPVQMPQILLTDLLTAKQFQVMTRVVNGRTNSQIARDLGLSPKTVSRHLTEAYNALQGIGELSASATNSDRRVEAAEAFRRMTRRVQLARWRRIE